MFYRKFQKFSNQLITRVLILVLTAFTSSNNPLPGASCSGIKFSHSQLSSLGPKQDFSASSSAGDVVSAGSGGTSNGGVDAVSGSATATGGGEILFPKSYPLSAQEPTCEELRAMWIFSKRQSRAAEITNEIPTYRDPFAYNVWEPYYSTTRSLGGLRMVPRYFERSRSPVFGRIISREPVFAPRLPLRPRHRGNIPSTTASSGTATRFYGAEAKPSPTGILPRHQMQYRFGGSGALGMGRSGVPTGGKNSNSVAVLGSFQKLKELIWTERAKELTQQRRSEELAARAAVLKEIANGQNVQPVYKHQQKSESPLMDDNRSPDKKLYDHVGNSRMSILDAQSGGRAHGTRHSSGYNLASRGGPELKTTFFSGNPASTSGRSARLLLPSMYSNKDDQNDWNAGSGVAKAFPVRSSHFRERNRALYKEPPANPDYFHRNQRRLDIPLQGAFSLGNSEQDYPTPQLFESDSSAENSENLDDDQEQLHSREINDKILPAFNQDSQARTLQEMVWSLVSAYPYEIDHDPST